MNKVYTKKEIKYCLGEANPVQHLAVRFAAKEAAIKALHQLGLANISWRDIEVVRTAKAGPALKINKLTKARVKVSLSHSQISALAMVVIFQ